MDYNFKVALFRAGRYTMTTAPDTVTWHWSEADWVQWIDQHGKWQRHSQTNEKTAFGHQWAADPTTGKFRLKLSA